MNVRLEMEVVNKYVQILMVVSNVPVNLDIIYTIVYSALVNLPLVFIVSISKITIDIDECSLNLTRCTQGCHNSVGSYQCTCQTGYYLGNDDHTCIG